MDVLLVMLPEKAREALNLISELALIATALIIIVFASPVIRDLYDFDQRSQSAEVPLYIPQALIPIGLAIMALLVLIRLLAGGARAASSGSSSH